MQKKYITHEATYSYNVVLLDTFLSTSLARARASTDHFFYLSCAPIAKRTRPFGFCPYICPFFSRF